MNSKLSSSTAKAACCRNFWRGDDDKNRHCGILMIANRNLTVHIECRRARIAVPAQRLIASADGKLYGSPAIDEIHTHSQIGPDVAKEIYVRFSSTS